MALGYIEMRILNQQRVISQLGFYYSGAGIYKRDIDHGYLACFIEEPNIRWGRKMDAVERFIFSDKVAFDEVFELLTPEQQDVAIWNLDLLK